MNNKLLAIIAKQKELSKKIKNESGEDIHSVLRVKNFSDAFLELEIKKNLLTDLIIDFKLQE